MEAPGQANDDNTTRLSFNAELDVIKTYLQRPDKLKIVDSFMANPAGTFLIDPTEDPGLLDIAVSQNEQFPAMVKKVILELLHEVVKTRGYAASDMFKALKVRVTNMSQIKMQELGPEYEGVPVAFECQVIGMDKPQTYTKFAKAWCINGHSEDVFADLVTKKIPEYILCTKDGCPYYKHRMKYDPNSYITSNIRRVIIQEPMDQAKHGTPVIFDCEVKDDDAPNVYIGQRKKIIGNFRSLRRNKGFNDIIIQAISVNDLDETEVTPPDAELLVKFQTAAAKQDYLDIITKSYAPVIYGEKLAKLCVILSILGGNRIENLRGTIHTFLCGDPSTGKSKILEFLTQVSPKADIVNGATASGHGITIGMDRDLKIPRAGPVPLCSGGHVGIDEMGRLPDEEDLEKLYECMESQTVSYTKGGWDLHINAKTAIIGAANPKGDVYDLDFSIVDNINLPEPLVRRFDLRVNLLDKPEPTRDMAKIEHIQYIRKYGVTKYIEDNKLFTAKELLAIFTYMAQLQPVMSEKADYILKNFYNDVRGIEQERGSLAIDTRFFESLYRVATAYAKLHFSNMVDELHVLAVIMLYRETFTTFGQSTEKTFKQLSMSSSITNQESAFIFSARTLEKKRQDGYFDESELLVSLATDHPQHFKNMDHAEAYFSMMLKNNRLLKHNGRYKLA